MILRYLLDSNFCIRVLRDRPAGLRDRFNNEADSLCISTIVLTKLLHGAAKSARPDHTRYEVNRFAARLEVLPIRYRGGQPYPPIFVPIRNGLARRSAEGAQTVARPWTVSEASRLIGRVGLPPGRSAHAAPQAESVPSGLSTDTG
ncbi:MAG TPA: type II toxin-antitoxin system VapC family toxin [Rhodopila sp.]